MYYLAIIALTMCSTIGFAITHAIRQDVYSTGYAICHPLLVLLFVLVVLGVLAVLIRVIPQSIFNAENKYFRVSGREIKFYKKIGIKKWKDKVPDLGWTAGFPKANLQSLEPEYLKKFIDETCKGELLHHIAGVLGFVALFIFPSQDFFLVLPIVLVNFLLHLLPCIIQRYNRARLLVAYKYHIRKQSLSTTNAQDDRIESNKDAIS